MYSQCIVNLNLFVIDKIFNYKTITHESLVFCGLQSDLLQIMLQFI